MHSKLNLEKLIIIIIIIIIIIFIIYVLGNSWARGYVTACVSV